MRKIPVTINHNHDYPIGWLQLNNDILSNEELVGMSPAWGLMSKDGVEVIELTLLPPLKSPAIDKET